jgi:hypothetical protein
MKKLWIAFTLAALAALPALTAFADSDRWN